MRETGSKGEVWGKGLGVEIWEWGKGTGKAKQTS